MFGKTANRCLLYCVCGAGSFTLGNLQEVMFESPRPGLSAAHLVFVRVMFWIGLVMAIAVIVRAFIDTTPADEAQAQKLLSPPQPGPDAGGQARQVTVKTVEVPGATATFVSTSTPTNDTDQTPQS